MNGGYQLIDISKYFEPFTVSYVSEEKDFNRVLTIDNPLHKELHDALHTEKLIILGNVTILDTDVNEKTIIRYIPATSYEVDDSVSVSASVKSEKYLSGVSIHLFDNEVGDIHCAFYDNWDDM